MSKDKEKKEKIPEEPVPAAETEPAAETPAESPAGEAPAPEADPRDGEIAALKEGAAQQEEKYLRLAAEYDNYRKRTTREKEAAWTDARGETVKAFLSVYDDLERALKQETADEAYKKGVEMTMAGLRKVLEGLGVTEIDGAGAPFDPNLHNAVMHIDDDYLGENTVCEVFQAGFMLGDQVLRYAMVKVAN